MMRGKSSGVRAVWLGTACALAAAACTSGVEETAPPQGLPRAAPGRYAEYPEKIASFGAAVLDGGLYVYSGHIGETHEHSIDNLSTSFRRLDLRSGGAAWQALSFREPVQSASLVADPGGALYRIGGMTAANGIDDLEEELYSVDSFERYDPGADAWTELPPLPETRSSHDAVVVGETIYVFGGWQLSGGDSASGVFYEKGLKLDLSAEQPAWVEIEQPFKRRAVCVAAAGSAVYVIGGITEQAEGSLVVDIYDTAAASWSVGPDAPTTEDHWNAFGCTAFAVDGAVVFSGRDGVISELGPDGWTPIGAVTTPRFFHRMLPNESAELLFVGGATIWGDHLSDIESFPRQAQ